MWPLRSLLASGNSRKLAWIAGGCAWLSNVHWILRTNRLLNRQQAGPVTPAEAWTQQCRTCCGISSWQSRLWTVPGTPRFHCSPSLNARARRLVGLPIGSCLCQSRPTAERPLPGNSAGLCYGCMHHMTKLVASSGAVGRQCAQQRGPAATLHSAAVPPPLCAAVWHSIPLRLREWQLRCIRCPAIRAHYKAL